MKKGILHHIEINVNSLTESKIFWNWFLSELGYKAYQEWAEGISWKLGDTYFVLVQTEKRFLDKEYHRKQAGLNHLAFHVEDEKAVDTWTYKLKEKGHQILYEEQHPYAGGKEHYAVFFEDPNRIKLELVANR